MCLVCFSVSLVCVKRVEVHSWRCARGGVLVEVCSWRCARGDAIVEVRSWRRCARGGGALVEVRSGRCFLVDLVSKPSFDLPNKTPCPLLTN